MFYFLLVAIILKNYGMNVSAGRNFKEDFYTVQYPILKRWGINKLYFVLVSESFFSFPQTIELGNQSALLSQTPDVIIVLQYVQ